MWSGWQDFQKWKVNISELKFKDFLDVKEKVIDKEQELQELNNRAAGEVVIRQALSELDVWEIDAKFTFIEHQASTGEHVPLIKDWKDVLNKVRSKQYKSVHFCIPNVNLSLGWR